MGNTCITSLCRHEEQVDFEDISDATFDFISVAVQKDALDSTSTSKTKTKSNARKIGASPASASTAKIVAVVPVALESSGSSRSIAGSVMQPQEDTKMSFNDRLNLFSWDPETTPLPTPLQHDEIYVFDEYSPQPTNVRCDSEPAKQKRSNWIRRAVTKYREAKSRRRGEAKNQRLLREEALTPRQTKKRSLRMTMWGSRMRSVKAKDQLYRLPLISRTSDVFADDDEDQRFLFDQETWMPTAQDEVQDFSHPIKAKHLDEEPISDTESDDSGSDATTLCFYSHIEEDSVLDEEEYDDVSDSDFSEWTRSSSTSSCYFSAAEDDRNSVVDATEHRFSLPSDVMLDDYLCECPDCPTYSAIEREVTNSNCWMNASERRALCRVLQAYSTLRPKTSFHKDMIASAEECLLVFQGDEQAAFNAFVMLAQTKW